MTGVCCACCAISKGVVVGCLRAPACCVFVRLQDCTCLEASAGLQKGPVLMASEVDVLCACLWLCVC